MNSCVIESGKMKTSFPEKTLHEVVAGFSPRRLKHAAAFLLGIFVLFVLVPAFAGNESVGSSSAPTPPAGKTDAPSISIVTLPVPTSPFFSIRALFHVGSIHDSKGKEGIAALTAATVGNGGTVNFTREQVLQKLYPLAGKISFNVDKEMTIFTGEVHQDNLPAFYELFSELLLKPRFDPSDFQREKENQVNYLQNTLRGTKDEALGKEILDGELYPDHPYGHASEGKIGAVNSLTIEEIKEFYSANMTQVRLEIGVAGNFPSDFPDRLRSDFSSLQPGTKAIEKLPAARRIQNIEITIVQKPADASAVSIGCPIDITRSDKDFYPLMVANAFLGEHRTFVGRLMINMREKRGLNYGDYSYIEHFIEGDERFAEPNIARRSQDFSIWIRPVKRGHELFSIKQAIRELNILIDKGMTEDEVKEYRQFVVNNSPLWVQTLSRRLGYLLDSRFYGIDDFVKKVQTEVASVKASEVNAAIKKHLQGKNLQVVIVAEKAEELKDDLLKNKDGIITYEKEKVPPEILSEDKIIAKYPLKIDKIRIIQGKDLFN